ncbi:MAG TPA: hypothetical protein VHY31_13060 [Streptosporangiaceae bacterium]|nr:hypothetical protein [Streptosporangiaceae bacterium]
MHGKAFGGYYFRNVIEALTASGHRVVVPDQIGWDKSPKPDIHYRKVAVLGHSSTSSSSTPRCRSPVQERSSSRPGGISSASISWR